MNIKKVDFDSLRDLVKAKLTVKEITRKLNLKSTSETKRFIFELCQIDKTFYYVEDDVPGSKGYINTKGQIVILSDFINDFALSSNIDISKDTKVNVTSNAINNSITITFG